MIWSSSSWRVWVASLRIDRLSLACPRSGARDDPRRYRACTVVSVTVMWHVWRSIECVWCLPRRCGTCGDVFGASHFVRSEGHHHHHCNHAPLTPPSETARVRDPRRRQVRRARHRPLDQRADLRRRDRQRSARRRRAARGRAQGAALTAREAAHRARARPRARDRGRRAATAAPARRGTKKAGRAASKTTSWKGESVTGFRCVFRNDEGGRARTPSRKLSRSNETARRRAREERASPRNRACTFARRRPSHTSDAPHPGERSIDRLPPPPGNNRPHQHSCLRQAAPYQNAWQSSKLELLM